MSKKPDQNEMAARIARETAARTESELPPDVESTWQQWSRGVGKLDSRTMALLRAAFEVGVEAGRKNPS